MTLENCASFHICLDIFSSYSVTPFINVSHLPQDFIFLINLMFFILRAYNLPLPGGREDTGHHEMCINRAMIK